ncbi:hypothetical protein Bca4012_027335 [Brassica carinata]
MASANVVLARNHFRRSPTGRSHQFIVGRLLRFWDSRNVKKQGEFMGITLLLLDEKNSVIHGFITAARSPYYRPFLKAGSIVRVSSFEVAKCTNMYKITDHPFLIRFIPQTTIHEVVDSALIINGEKFMLRKFDPLRSLANTNLELPDVVGKIQSVQGSDLTDAGVTTRVVVRLVIDPLGGPAGEGFTCIDTKNGIKKKEVVSIGELNKFITNSDEQTQEADFICKARVVEVLQQNGWSFVSCTGCSKKLEKIGSSLRCRRCANPNVTGVIKYRVERCVDDGVDNATFVVFDREMVKLTKQDAAGLTLTEMNGGGGEELPQCVRDLAGKELVFQIRVTPVNFTPSHRDAHRGSQSPTASLPSEASASVGKKVDDKKPSPPDAGSAKGSRKRPRE